MEVTSQSQLKCFFQGHKKIEHVFMEVEVRGWSSQENQTKPTQNTIIHKTQQNITQNNNTPITTTTKTNPKSPLTPFPSVAEQILPAESIYQLKQVLLQSLKFMYGDSASSFLLDLLSHDPSRGTTILRLRSDEVLSPSLHLPLPIPHSLIHLFTPPPGLQMLGSFRPR